MRFENSKRVSSSRQRKLLISDFSTSVSSIIRSLSKTTKAVSKLVDIELWWKRLIDGEVPSVVLDDQLLLVYTVDSPWYGNKLMVQELLVLRIAEGNATLSVVDDFLMDIADQYGAVGIEVGGALSDRPRVLSRAYRKLGYQEEDSPGLYKWRHNG